MDSIPKTIYDVTVQNLDGQDVKLEDFRGKCILIVNIAFDCKLSKENFKCLREVKREFANDLAVLLFPCNQFMGLRSVELSDIANFVHDANIDFAETFAPVDVTGSDAHPLFELLKSKRPGCIAWNFTKFIVSRNGLEIVRFNHSVMFSAIEDAIRKFV